MARGALRASGERVPEPSKKPHQGLSPQELQIAKMAAEGLSNREIADRLFLSHRMVGAHLYRVYPKRGIVSRSELARALAAIDDNGSPGRRNRSSKAAIRVGCPIPARHAAGYNAIIEP